MGLPRLHVGGCQRERVESASQKAEGDLPVKAVRRVALVDGTGLRIQSRAEGNGEHG